MERKMIGFHGDKVSGMAMRHGEAGEGYYLCDCCMQPERYLLKLTINMPDASQVDGLRSESAHVCRGCLIEMMKMIDNKILNDRHAEKS